MSTSISSALKLAGTDPTAPHPMANRLASFAIFQDLTNEDRNFLAAMGSSRSVGAGAVVPLALGEEIAMLIVLSGSMRLGSERPGEGARVLTSGDAAGLTAMVGSNQTEQKAGLNPVLAVAREKSEVLLIPQRVLRARCTTAPALAARIYRMCARALADRVTDREEVSPSIAAMWQTIREFQVALHDAERGALENNGCVPESLSIPVREGFRRLVQQLNNSLGEDCGLSDEERDALGQEVQRAVLPYLLLTNTSERLYAKPRGYAGDSVSIDGIYANNPSGVGRLGPLLDQCFLDEPAAQAVRNRRSLLREEIEAVLAKEPARPVRVTTMACGPAREVFDVFESLDDPTRLVVNLIDFDEEALEQVRLEAAERGLLEQLNFHHANLIELSIGRQKIDLPPQDLVYSIGLIDYFIDKLVVRLMSYGHKILRPGGEMILGNFHPANENKALMDHVLDWRLIHRTEDDLDRLFAASGFQRGCTRFRFEETGVNLFATCRRRVSNKEQLHVSKRRDTRSC